MTRLETFRFQADRDIKNLRECRETLTRSFHLLGMCGMTYMSDQVRALTDQVSKKLTETQEMRKNIQRELDKLPCKECGGSPCWCIKEG